MRLRDKEERERERRKDREGEKGNQFITTRFTWFL